MYVRKLTVNIRLLSLEVLDRWVSFRGKFSLGFRLCLLCLDLGRY